MDSPLVPIALVAAFMLLRFIARKIKSGGSLALLGGSDCYSLLANGVPARGILLRVGNRLSLQGAANPGYYEVRAVRIDVEVPGEPPYECDCSLYVPANLRRLVLPGATVELRVDRGSKNIMALYGPGVGLPAI